MRISSEYLPATGGARQELVLLHGWGSNREIWRPLLALLRPWANVTLADVPGCTTSGEKQEVPGLSQTLEALLDCAPEQAVYVGWSLGGQLAVELATRYPGRVAALVTICSNPCFVATREWPGMDPAEFERFRAGFLADPLAALPRFNALQTRGSPRQRGLLRELNGLLPRRACPQLEAGLGWLQDLDQRSELPALSQPQLHLLGGRDALVPAALYAKLSRLLSNTAAARVVSLPESGHLAPLEAPAQLAGAVGDMLAENGLLRAAPVPNSVVAKEDVADSFSRSARLYDSVARLQRDVGSKLLTRLDDVQLAPSVVLDLGSGTGSFYPELAARFPQAHYIGLDLAQGMTEYARTRFPGSGTWLVGDAESLPLAADSIDLVFSSLAIQWCYRPVHLFAELARVLRPGGRCVFTSLGPDTLRELRTAWAAVDTHQHVNTFFPATELVMAARDLPGVDLHLEAQLFRMEYQRVRDLLSELKTLGAHNMNRQRRVGLTGRRELQGMLEAYEEWREDGVLPATYDVMFGVLEKV